MIVAKLKDAADYRGIHPMLDKALDYLNDGFLNTVGTEATHMEGNDSPMRRASLKRTGNTWTSM